MYGGEVMMHYGRCIGGFVIHVILDNSLYEEEQGVFDAILSSFSLVSEPIAEEQNANTYYIMDSRRSTAVVRRHWTVCNLRNADWIFVLTSNLEFFFAGVLKCTVVHSSCVKIHGQSLLLMGERFSGKTSLTKYLSIDRNGEYIDDDCVYIVENEYIGFCLPLPMRNVLSTKGDEHIIGQTTDEDGILRTLYSPPNFVSHLPSVEVIAFLKYNQNGINSIRKMTMAEAFNQVIKNIRRHSGMKTMFTDINHLVSNARCYVVEYTQSDLAYNMMFDDSAF